MNGRPPGDPRDGGWTHVQPDGTDVHDTYVTRVADGWAVLIRGGTVSQFGDETDEDLLWLACRWASHLARTHGGTAWLVGEGQRARIVDQ